AERVAKRAEAGRTGSAAPATDADKERAQFRSFTIGKAEQAPLFSLSGPIIGIDLGTVNTCVAIVEKGRPRVLTTPDGYETVPSVVFVAADNAITVGRKAMEKMILEPSRGIHGSKRFLGRPFASKEVRSLGHFFNYKLVAGANGRVAAQVGDTTLPLEEVSAHILRLARDMASKLLGQNIGRAVITVPAYFGETQRQAVREAGKLAGLHVERIINEPTAAAVAYGFGHKLKRTILVYDMGGGTFDASLLRIDGDTLEVLATDGDPFLGGQDFDDRMTEYVLMTFERTHGVNIRSDSVAVQRLRFAAQATKHQLSEADTAALEVPYIAQSKGGQVDLRMTFERKLLEELTQDLVNRTLTIVDSVLRTAGVTSTQLDDVLLVGGQSRSPHVRRALVERFGRK
ncbi:MAG TPA: Hsp70 family protein, partial [Myxococcota bacterium]|nr:Hsp70 family protein [Myxococcota bacterium]